MKQTWKNWFPAVLAILVFLVVELIDLLGIVSPEQWDKFEQISNGVMFAIAVLGLLGAFLDERAFQADSGRKMVRILSNVAVPVIAFYMNISVFQHTIRLEHVWKDIWSIHILWLLCAAVQILLLSGLGGAILNVVRSFLNVVCSLLGETKKAAKRLRDAARDTINCAGNYMLCAVFVSFICWAVYIGAQIYINGAASIFAGTVVFSRSVWFWTASLLICLLVRIFPLAVQKAVEGVNNQKGEIVLGAIAAIALAVLACVMPSFAKIIAMLILIPLAAICMLWFIIRKLSQPWRKLGNRSQGGSSDTGNSSTGNSGTGNLGTGTPGEELPNGGLAIKYSDLAVVLLSFVVPLVIILIITALQPEGRAILTTQDPLDIDTWLGFRDEVAEVAQKLLKLFA